jgi:heme exporter protein D
MGGYAAFIWPAYGIAALVIGGLIVMSFQRLARVRAELSSLENGKP